jgi:hypothetical protein
MCLAGLLTLIDASPDARALHNVEGQARTPLQAASTVSCEFTLMAAGNWDRAGAPTAGTKPAMLKVSFANIDTEVGDAETAGLTGTVHIVARFAGGYLHLFRVDSSGFLHATTVFDKVSRPGKLKAVHTRHEYTDIALPGFTSKPEQYYGECEIG